MKRPIVLWTISLLLVVLFSSFAYAISWDDGKLTVDYSTSVYYEKVYGNASKSSLDVSGDNHDQWHYNQSLKVRLNQKITDDLALEMFGYVRNTSDGKVMDHQWYLLQAYLRIYNDNFELAAGDISEYLSRYTFNNTFLGAKLWYRPSSRFKFIVLGGRNRDPNEDLYEHFFGGARVEYSPNSLYLFGLNYIHTEITDLKGATTLPDYRNDVWSLDTKMRFLDRKLILGGEFAGSEYSDDTGKDLDGWAVDLELDYRPIRELKLSLDYERVEPDFRTIMGTAPIDNEIIKAGFSYRPSEIWNFWGEYKFTRNDLGAESEAQYRTYKNYGVLGSDWRPFNDASGYFKNLKLELQFDYTDKISNDHPRSVNSDGYQMKFLASNRYDKMYYAFEYRFTYDDDHTLDGEDSMTNTFGVKWAYSLFALNLDWKLGLGYKVNLKNTYEKDPNETIFSTTHVIDADLGLFYAPTKTSFSASYIGSFTDAEDADNIVRNGVKVALEQVLYESDSLKSIAGISYENMDFKSSNEEDSYGHNICMFYMTFHF